MLKAFYNRKKAPKAKYGIVVFPYSADKFITVNVNNPDKVEIVKGVSEWVFGGKTIACWDGRYLTLDNPGSSKIAARRISMIAEEIIGLSCLCVLNNFRLTCKINQFICYPNKVSMNLQSLNKRIKIDLPVTIDSKTETINKDCAGVLKMIARVKRCRTFRHALADYKALMEIGVCDADVENHIAKLKFKQEFTGEADL